MVIWISVSIANRALPGGGNTRQRLKRIVSSTAFWIVCGTPLIVFAVTAFAQTNAAAHEPLAFFSGISIWPSEMLRLIALMLAIHFMIKSWNRYARECARTRGAFLSRPALAQKFRLARYRDRSRSAAQDGRERQARNRNFPPRKRGTPTFLRNQFWPRFIRIGSSFHDVFRLCDQRLSSFSRSRRFRRGARWRSALISLFWSQPRLR